MQVKETQKKVLIGVGVLVLAMLVYPPYHISTSFRTLESGYDFIFALPHRATIDVATLLAQWVGVLVVGAIAFLLAKDK